MAFLSFPCLELFIPHMTCLIHFITSLPEKEAFNRNNPFCVDFHSILAPSRDEDIVTQLLAGHIYLSSPPPCLASMVDVLPSYHVSNPFSSFRTPLLELEPSTRHELNNWSPRPKLEYHVVRSMLRMGRPLPSLDTAGPLPSQSGSQIVVLLSHVGHPLDQRFCNTLNKIDATTSLLKSIWFCFLGPICALHHNFPPDPDLGMR